MARVEAWPVSLATLIRRHEKPDAMIWNCLGLAGASPERQRAAGREGALLASSPVLLHVHCRLHVLAAQHRADVSTSSAGISGRGSFRRASVPKWRFRRASPRRATSKCWAGPAQSIASSQHHDGLEHGMTLHHQSAYNNRGRRLRHRQASS
ncbi:hypothetical protein BS50DRAFT_294888 [Corynespora cassiicola Philippines]|uniref:Uncharacterized protein n=1 Tax=Corynespora cassiicola Philippines TaxID=1448308 RepID=A0A2T2NWP8_CORCC|nr:hypothetical protein BS50DRAFT_294888 [Corynespora cassiicola Philippines]